MSITRTVSLDCDGTSQYCQGGFEGDTVAEVRAEAKAAGWTLGGIDLCPECHPKRMAEQEIEDREWSEYQWQMRRQDVAKILSVGCPSCGVDPGARCITQTGKPIGNPFQSHAARLKAAPR